MRWTPMAVLVFILVACTSQPIENVERASFDGPTPLDQAQTAIMRAGTSLGWEMSEVAPGQIRGTLAVRRHVAVVDVTYDMEGFSIICVDSDGLDYDDDDTIHRNYNRWVRNLEREIRAEAFQWGRAHRIG